VGPRAHGTPPLERSIALGMLGGMRHLLALALLFTGCGGGSSVPAPVSVIEPPSLAVSAPWVLYSGPVEVWFVSYGADAVEGVRVGPLEAGAVGPGEVVRLGELPDIGVYGVWVGYAGEQVVGSVWCQSPKVTVYCFPTGGSPGGGRVP
jgi:hypothetical protein